MEQKENMPVAESIPMIKVTVMLMKSQMSFEAFEPVPDGNEAREPDIVDAHLAVHNGDYRAAMRELLLDADFLRDQLAIAHRLMSHGYGRGWKPKYERI